MGAYCALGVAYTLNVVWRMVYIWSFTLNGLQTVKTATKSQFEKELEEYTKAEQKRIRKTVKFTRM